MGTVMTSERIDCSLRKVIHHLTLQDTPSLCAVWVIEQGSNLLVLGLTSSSLERIMLKIIVYKNLGLRPHRQDRQHLFVSRE